MSEETPIYIIKANEYASKFYNPEHNPISFEEITKPFIEGFKQAMQQYAAQQKGEAVVSTVSVCPRFTGLDAWKCMNCGRPKYEHVHMIRK